MWTERGWLFTISLLAGLALATLLVSVSDASAFARRALVIGIDGYSDKALEVPGGRTREDAVQVSSALVIAQYDTVVTVAPDSNKQMFIATLEAFLDTVEEGDMVVVFYSGHGVEFNGDNYLMLRDATAALPVTKLARQSALESVAVSQRGLMDALREKNPKFLVLIINACRTRADDQAILGGAIDIRAPQRLSVRQPSTMVIYATASGTPAFACLSDDKECSTDPSPMTVFTRRLVSALSIPNLPAKDLYEMVGEQVEADVSSSIGELQTASLDDQIPFAEQKQLFLGPVTADPPFVRASPKPIVPAIRPVRDTQTLALNVQKELQRLGCYKGALDGNWGPSSQKALADFAKRSSFDFGSKDPSENLLETLILEKGGPVCVVDVKPQHVAVMAVNGIWTFSSDCNSGSYNGTIELNGPRGTLRGLVTGAISDVTVKGHSLNFVNKYNAFGSVVEYWSGTIAKNGQSVGGSLSDTTGDRCIFSLAR